MASSAFASCTDKVLATSTTLIIAQYLARLYSTEMSTLLHGVKELGGYIRRASTLSLYLGKSCLAYNTLVNAGTCYIAAGMEGSPVSRCSRPWFPVSRFPSHSLLSPGSSEVQTTAYYVLVLCILGNCSQSLSCFTFLLSMP